MSEKISRLFSLLAEIPVPKRCPLTDVLSYSDEDFVKLVVVMTEIGKLKSEIEQELTKKQLIPDKGCSVVWVNGVCYCLNPKCESACLKQITIERIPKPT
jgi:hypothetical protein